MKHDNTYKLILPDNLRNSAIEDLKCTVSSRNLIYRESGFDNFAPEMLPVIVTGAISLVKIILLLLKYLKDSKNGEVVIQSGDTMIKVPATYDEKKLDSLLDKMKDLKNYSISVQEENRN